MDAAAKTYFCTAFRQILMKTNAVLNNEEYAPIPVFSNREAATHVAEEHADVIGEGLNPKPTVLWMFSYDTLDEIEPNHWTLKPEKDFV